MYDKRDLNGTEQRVGLTTIPRRSDTLTVTPTGVPSGRLDALLYGGQDESWAVPEWPRATWLDADATAGASVTLACNSFGHIFRNSPFDG